METWRKIPGSTYITGSTSLQLHPDRRLLQENDGIGERDSLNASKWKYGKFMETKRKNQPRRREEW